MNLLFPPAFIWIGSIYYANPEIRQPGKSEKMRAGIKKCGSAMNSFCFMFFPRPSGVLFRACQSSSCQKPVPMGSLLQSMRLSAQYGFSKENPCNRHQMVWNGSPDCSTTGLTSETILLVIDVDRIWLLFLLVILKQTILGQTRGNWFFPSFHLISRLSWDFSSFPTWIPLSFYYSCFFLI